MLCFEGSISLDIEQPAVALPTVPMVTREGTRHDQAVRSPIDCRFDWLVADATGSVLTRFPGQFWEQRAIDGLRN